MAWAMKGLMSCCAVVVCVLLAAPIGAQTPKASASPARSKQAEASGRLPLSFEPNQGQTNAEVKFLARGSGYGLFLTPTEMVLALSEPRAKSSHEASNGKGTALRMKLVGANAKPQVVGERQLPGKSNYFFGEDPAKWRRNIPQFAGVRYRSVYPGVDLVYYGNQRQLEYDFVVAPGANPRAIRIDFGGASSMKVNASGDLVLAVGRQEITVCAPVAYQAIDGAKQIVAGRFVVRGAREVSFEIGRYDTSRPLTIDPTVVYSTYLGGSGSDQAWGTVDQAGSVYLAGMTSSPDFTGFPQYLPYLPETMFISKLSADGRSVIYSAFFALIGNPAIAVDSLGHAYVAAVSASAQMPVVNAVQATCPNSPCLSRFVLKLGPQGDNLVYSTFLGGTASVEYWAYSFWNRNYDRQYIASDSSGNTYLVGETDDPTFPVVNALQGAIHGGVDAFVVKLNPTGGWIYSTFLGGSGGDDARSVAVDGQGQAYVAGVTGSTDFPTANAIQPAHAPVDSSWNGSGDGFLAKLMPDGSRLVYSTYLGGSGGDFLASVVVNAEGTAWVAGGTFSSDFPTSPDRPRSNWLCSVWFEECRLGVLVKFDADGQLIFSTAVHTATYLAVDSAENIYLATGDGASAYMTPLVKPLMSFTNSLNAYVEKLDPTATTVLFSTFWGGTGRPSCHPLNPEYCEYPGDHLLFLGVDGAGNIYMVGVTSNDDFPTANAMQPELHHLAPPVSWIPTVELFVVKLAQSDNTPTGTQVAVVPADGATITFDGVASPGTTGFARSADLSSLGYELLPPPTDLRLGDPAVFYEISTTAAYTGGITVCLDYSKITFGVEWGLGLYHYENGSWVNITTSVDAANNRICGVATSLSPFAIFGAPLPPVEVAGLAPPLGALVPQGTAVVWPDKAFKFGRTLPLKLQLLVNGAPLTDQEVKGPKIVEISRQGDSVLNLATLDLNTGASNDNGLVFRFSDGSWVYNLNTQALSTGRYVITIQLWDGRRFQGGFELKR
jgi:hypothetical protein